MIQFSIQNHSWLDNSPNNSRYEPQFDILVEEDGKLQKNKERFCLWYSDCNFNNHYFQKQLLGISFTCFWGEMAYDIFLLKLLIIEKNPKQIQAFRPSTKQWKKTGFKCKWRIYLIALSSLFASSCWNSSTYPDRNRRENIWFVSFSSLS